MELFAINKNLLGEDRHIIINGNTENYVDEIPSDILSVGSKEFNELSKLYLLELPEFPSKNYLKTFQLIQNSMLIKAIPWSLCIPGEAYKCLKIEFINQLKLIFKKLDLEYWNTTYKETNLVLQDLKPFLINQQLLNKFYTEDQNTHLNSFKPDELGYSKPIIYDRVSTITGRLKIVEGPNILHLKKEYRSVINSRFGNNGSIWSLDFKSIEPRAMLYLSTNGRLPKKESDRDLYEVIRKELFEGHDISRADVKHMVLSELYGAGLDLISQQLPHIQNIDKVMILIQDYFELTKFKLRLIKQTEGKNTLINFYGRPISISDASPYMYPNRMIQSTAVDISLYGFKNIIDYIKYLNREFDILPIAVLHDALFLDIKKEAEHIIPTLCKVGSMIPKFNIPFYIEAQKL